MVGNWSSNIDRERMILVTNFLLYKSYGVADRSLLTTKNRSTIGQKIFSILIGETVAMEVSEKVYLNHGKKTL